MANTKEYKIVINGVQQSIDAVKSLEKELNNLEERIKALESRTIGINGGSSGGSGGSSRTSNKSSLSEEEKLLKNIETTEKKIEAYSKSVYQNYLAAKDVLKETLNDQKQIAATERLQANNYTNTMAGLKSKLADIKQVMQTTDIGSDIFKKYTAEANEITNKLKELEEAYGQFGRNVGNYKSAAEGFNKIKVAVGDTTREFDNYRQAMKSLMQERFQLAQSVGQETKEYKNVDTALKQLQSTYQDLNRSSQFMDNMLDTVQTVSSLASVGTGLSILFGIDDGAFEESMKRLAALMLTLKGLEEFKQMWQKDEGWFFKPFRKLSEGMISWGEKIGNNLAEGIKKAWDDRNLNQGTLGKAFWKYFKKQMNEFQKQAESMSDGDMFTEYAEAKHKRYNNGETLSEWWHKDQKSFDQWYKDQFNVWHSLDEAERRQMYAMAKATEKVDNLANRFKKFGNVATNVITKVTKLLGGMFTVGFMMMLPEVLEWLGDFVKSLNTTKIAAENAASGLNAFNRQLEARRELLNASYLRGELTNEEYLKNIYDEQTNSLIKQIDVLRTRAKALKNDFEGITDIFKFFNATQNTEFSGNKLSSPTTVGHGRLAVGFNTLFGMFDNDLEITVKNIKEVEKAWKDCVKAIENGNDYFTENGSGVSDWFNSLIVTVKDTEEVMRGLGNVKLSDTIAQFQELNRKYKEGEIDADQYAQAIHSIAYAMNNNEVLNSVIANLDKYIPDEGVRTAVQNIINELMRLDDAFNMTSEQQVRYWNQVRIDTMKDGLKKTLAQIDENERIEIKEHGKTQEQISLIEAKYARQRQEAREKEAKDNLQKAKEANKKLIDAENQLIALRIANMKEGFDKRMAELDNQKRLELQKLAADAKDNKYIKVQEMTLEINKKYDKLILDEKRKWAFETLKVYEDLAARIDQVNKATFDIEASTANQNVDNKTRRGQSETGYQMITPTNYDDSKNLEEYYRKIVDIKKKAAEREFAIEQERLDKQLDFDKKEEELRHKRLLDENGGEYITQLRAGLITQEEYDKLIEDENDAHYARMNALDKQYASNLSAATEDSLEKTQKLYSDFYGNIINNLRRDKSKVDEIVNKQPVTDTAGWGVVNMGKTSQNYTNALAEYDKIKQEILKKQTELEQDLKNHSISAEDFAIRQEDLKNEIKAIDEACKSVKESQKMLIADFIQSIDKYIQAAMNSFSTIMNAVWDAQDVANDKEAEALDKANEILEKKLDEQQEIVEQHKSKIDSIEDELSTARGDRRQHLIDQLNAEMAAQREAQAQEKKIQKEKEANERKQEELEKKRKKQQYQRDMIQAIVNGAMAVTFAAANNWPIPAIPMMALAASTTAAQIAIMAANKPYAKGGLLEGPSHAEGGIPVGRTGIEVEGKEYVIRKKSTAPNIEILDYINKSERKLDLDDFIEFYSSGKVRKTITNMSPRSRFADGGVVPTLSTSIDINDRLLSAFEDYSNRPVYVSVQDINSRQKAVKDVQVLAGLTE